MNDVFQGLKFILVYKEDILILTNNNWNYQ